MPRLDPQDAADLVDILTCWMDGHDISEIDDLVRKVKSRLAFQAATNQMEFAYGDCSMIPQGAD